ncbi:hypothetical protein DFH08DRAFT_964054 [Mycena albidolilacea]|uniref:Uncharacterized protein n=1 Tax=Mycena albidolilacea TaxID=1033008 RepID=A0AAD6ZUI7_9AGAR|nr:hypothetical protein DFH08DRAFT_964054 [Mycena albidolilacea]
MLQRLTQLSGWLDDWKEFTSFNGSVYYTSDDAKLLTTEDVCDPRIRKLVFDIYDTQQEWFEDIDADDAEMQVFNVCVAPTVLLASWSLGETYEYSTEGLIQAQRDWFEDIDADDAEMEVFNPERRAAFWDYAREFSAYRKYLPKHLEAEFVTALAFVSNGKWLPA